MKTKIQILSLFLMLFSMKALAQTPYFEVILNKVSIASTGSANDSIPVSYYLKYHDSLGKSPFKGKIITHYKTQKDTTPSVCGTFGTIDSATPIRNNDTAIFTSYIKVTQGYFRNGQNNIIIIWPTGDRSNGTIVGTSDTVHTTKPITISGLAGFAGELNRPNALRIYPNPSSTYLNLEMTDPALKLKSIRIMDMSGKEMVVSQTNLEKIEVSQLKAGNYFLEVNDIDNRKATYSFIIVR